MNKSISIVVTQSGRNYSLRCSPSYRVFRTIKDGFKRHGGDSSDARKWSLMIVNSIADQIERLGMLRALRLKNSWTPDAIMTAFEPALTKKHNSKILRQVIYTRELN